MEEIKEEAVQVRAGTIILNKLIVNQMKIEDIVEERQMFPRREIAGNKVKVENNIELNENLNTKKRSGCIIYKFREYILIYFFLMYHIIVKFLYEIIN